MLYTLDFPYHVDYASITPFDQRNNPVLELRKLWRPGDFSNIVEELRNCYAGQAGLFRFFQKVFALGIDGNAALGHKDINHFARAGYSGYFFPDDWDAFPEGRRRDDGAAG